VIYRAQSGTGKTATFSISTLQCLDTQVRETQALILSPTRELATQIQKVSVFDNRSVLFTITMFEVLFMLLGFYSINLYFTFLILESKPVSQLLQPDLGMITLISN
jgi:hypothetical protein